MESKAIGRSERIEKWTELLDKAGITKDQIDNIVIAHIEGPAIFPPTDKIVVIIPSGFILLAEWADKKEWDEIVERLPNGS